LEENREHDKIYLWLLKEMNDKLLRIIEEKKHILKITK
jgi:hypothetical protein